MTGVGDLLLVFLLSYLPFRLALAPVLRALTALERLTLAFAAALGAFYLAGFLCFAAPAAARAGVLAPFGVCAVAAVLHWRRGGRAALSIPREEWRLSALLLLAGLWLLCLQWTIGNYVGGGWFGDWWEHFRRMEFFYHRLDPGTHVFGYHVTARPPFGNVVASFVARIVGATFAEHQVVFAFLASLVVLPAALLFERLRAGAPAEERSTALVACALSLHSMTVINASYPWTRILTTFFVLCGLCFYRRSERWAQAVAFLLLGCATQCHFSAWIVAVPVLAHAAFVHRWPPLRWGRLAAFGAAIVLPALPWLAWSGRTYGWSRPFATSSTSHYLRSHALHDIAGQMAYNAAGTFVPFLRARSWVDLCRQEDAPALALDLLHLHVTGSLVGAISTGLCLSLVVVAALSRRFPSLNAAQAAEHRWVLGVCAASVVLGFPVVPNPEVAGIAHLALQPVCLALFLAGLALLNDTARWTRLLLVAALAVEGLVLHVLKGWPRVPGAAEPLYSFAYALNLRLKEEQHLQFLADLAPSWAEAARLGVFLSLPVIVWGLWRLYALGQSTAPSTPVSPR